MKIRILIIVIVVSVIIFLAFSMRIQPFDDHPGNHVEELQEKANTVMTELQTSGHKIIDTDVAGRASEAGQEWVMTIVYDNNPQ